MPRLMVAQWAGQWQCGTSEMQIDWQGECSALGAPSWLLDGCARGRGARCPRKSILRRAAAEVTSRA